MEPMQDSPKSLYKPGGRGDQQAAVAQTDMRSRTRARRRVAALVPAVPGPGAALGQPDQNSEKDFAAFIDYVVEFDEVGESRMDCALRTLDLTATRFTNDHVAGLLAGIPPLRLHLQLKFSRMENYEGGRLVLPASAPSGWSRTRANRERPQHIKPWTRNASKWAHPSVIEADLPGPQPKQRR